MYPSLFSTPCVSPSVYVFHSVNVSHSVCSSVYIPFHVYPISYVPLHVFHSLHVYLTLCLSHSVCIPLRAYPTLCVSYSVCISFCPTSCASHFVYSTLYMSHISIQLRESPTSMPHFPCIPPSVFHPVCPTSVCLTLCVFHYTPPRGRLYLTLCVSFGYTTPCAFHFMCVLLPCVPSPVGAPPRVNVLRKRWLDHLLRCSSGNIKFGYSA